MGREGCVSASLFMRKLGGGSQPILVRANDGYFYIVKFLDNPQGPNLLFNEALGTELYRRVGLLTPEWRPVHVSEDFLDRYPECWMETQDGRLRPKAGWCFGSRYLSLRNSVVFEILPNGRFSDISNRRDFWTARVLDAFCGHADNRQALFLGPDSRSLRAYFIDHGHLFWGPFGTDYRSCMASQYLDPGIYADASAEDADRVQGAILSLDIKAFSNVPGSLPDGWRTEAAISALERFTSQVSDPIKVRKLVGSILMAENIGEAHARRRSRYADWLKSADLHGQISLAGVDDRVVGRRFDLTCDQGRRRPKAVHSPCLLGADF